MRRAIQTLLLALSSLVLVVLPAAAEETDAAESFGAGRWDGLLLALVFGAILGAVLFIDAYAVDDESDDH